MKPEVQAEVAWDAPVKLERLQTVGGISAPGFAVVAETESGGVVVGGYQKESPLLQNRDAVAATESALERLGWEYERSIRVLRGGGGLVVDYEIQGMDFALGHDAARPMIRLRNSYDGKNLFCGEFLAKVLVCLNGMEGLGAIAGLSQRHSSKLSLASIAEKLPALFEAGKNGLGSLESLAEIPLADNQVLNLFGNLAKYSKGGIPKRMAARMAATYFSPDEGESRCEPSFWRAYMAGTRTLRDYAEVKPTAASKANMALGQVLGLAARRSKPFGTDAPAQLVAPTSSEFSLVEVIDI